jgi:hypothetical protein
MLTHSSVTSSRLSAVFFNMRTQSLKILTGVITERNYLLTFYELVSKEILVIEIMINLLKNISIFFQYFVF